MLLDPVDLYKIFQFRGTVINVIGIKRYNLPNEFTVHGFIISNSNDILVCYLNN